MIYLLIILSYAIGIATGGYVAFNKFTNEAIKDFCENQKLRDENRWLKEQNAQLSKALNEHGVI